MNLQVHRACAARCSKSLNPKHECLSRSGGMDFDGVSFLRGDPRFTVAISGSEERWDTM